MIRHVANLCLLPVFAAALLACSAGKNEPEENPNIFPADYKNEILNTLTSALDNPTNVRDAYIGEPTLRAADKDERYIICMKFDARDAANRYTGSKDRIGYFYGGHLNQLVEATNGQCRNAVYKPFPELEHLCQAKKCV